MSRYTPRRASKRDANEAEIIKELKAAGATVEQLDVVDLLVGFYGRNYLLEVKNPDYPHAHKERRERQAIWRAAWAGEVTEVETPEEALAALRPYG